MRWRRVRRMKWINKKRCAAGGRDEEDAEQEDAVGHEARQRANLVSKRISMCGGRTRGMRRGRSDNAKMTRTMRLMRAMGKGSRGIGGGGAHEKLLSRRRRGRAGSVRLLPPLIHAPLPFLYHLYTPRRDALYFRLLPLILIPTNTGATNTSNHRNTRKIAAATMAAPPTVDDVVTLIRGESLSVDGGGRAGGGSTVVVVALGVREVGLCARVGARRKKA